MSTRRSARALAALLAAACAIALPVALSASTAAADSPPFSIIVPANISAEATSGAGAAVSFDVTSTPMDPPAAIACDHSSGDTFPLGSTTVSCTATTATEVSPGTFTITVVDTTKPSVSTAGNQTVAASSPAGAVVNFAPPTASDLVDGSVSASCSPGSGSTFAVGTTTVTCTATDAHSNTGSASFTVRVTDQVPPELHLPSNVTVTTSSPAGTSVSFTATATDNVDGNLPASCSPASGATFPVGTTTVQCSARDAAGNSSSGSFSVTVNLTDTTPPVVTAPADVTQEASSSTGATVSFPAASAHDNVDGDISASCDHVSPSAFPIGATTVTCSATDAHNNKGTDTFRVTVRDTTQPTLHLPGADVAVSTSNPGGAVATFSATATDTVDGSVQAVCTPASGATFAVGPTSVSCHATDAHGNTATGSFTVRVTFVDATPPVVTVPADLTREAQSSAGAQVSYTASASDAIDGAITPVCTPTSGSTFPLGSTTVTCTASDQAHNSASKTFTITVHDTTKPVVHVPSPEPSVEATSPEGAAVTFAASADDAVGPAHPSVICTPASGSTFEVGSSAVSCTATDAHGNEGTASFHVRVVDTGGPVVTVPPDIIREANGPAGAVVTFTVAATDAADGPLTPAVISCAPLSGSSFAVGRTTVTCTATDSHNNAGHASFAVTVKDTTAPRLNVPAATSVTAQGDLPATEPAIAAFLRAANATDLVDGTVAVVTNAPGRFPMGATTVTFTATDRSGNKTIATSTLTLTAAPVAPAPPPDAQPPGPVSSLAAKGADGSVKLTWALPADRDFDHVVVEQSTGAAPLAVVYTGTNTTFVAKGLRNGAEYRFVLVAYDKAGNASSEAAAVATPAAPPLIAPKDGALMKTPPLLRWRTVAGASYYNVQIYRVPGTAVAANGPPSGVKVLSAWPTAASLRLHTAWTFTKKRFQLTPGVYRWYVWAGFGARAEVTYGPLLGRSTFVIQKTKKKTVVVKKTKK